MARSIRIAVGILLCCFILGSSADVDSQGQEFVFAIPRPSGSCGAYIVLTTSVMETVNVDINIPSINFRQQHNVARNEMVSVSLSSSACLSAGSGVKPQTVTIQSTRPVSVHVFNHVNYPSSHGDGFLALPTARLGSTYYIASFEPWDSSNYYSYFAISSLDNPTSIDITPKDQSAYTVNLQPYETYLVEVKEDPTGTRLIANRPITVVSGAVCAGIPAKILDCDSLLEQLPSVEQIGQNFVLGPFMGRDSGYICRVIGVNETATNVSISNNDAVQLNAGDMYEVDINNDAVLEISSDKPVLVMQYMKSSDTDGKGDASMVLVPSVDFFSGNVSFPVPEVSSNSYYVHVTIECAYMSTLTFDGSSMTDWEVLTSDSGDMCILRNQVTPDVHSIEHVKASFYVTIYGYRRAHSYTYPAGFNLHKALPTTEAPPTTTQESPIVVPPISDVQGLYLYCEGTNMTAIFNYSVIPFTRASEVHLWDSNCTASEYGESYAIITTDFPGCQTVMEQTKDHIIFRNALILDTSNPASPIRPPQVEIQCRVERKHIVETSFSSSIKRKISFGNFSFGLQIFHDQTFLTPYEKEDYPIDVKFGASLYFAASVDAVKELEVFVDSCWGTPSANPWHETTYSVIYDGCPNEESVVFFDSGDPNIQQFTFKAFAFKGDSWLVFIHCQLLVCDVGAPNSRCAQGCIETTDISPRKRRSSADLYVISSGPLVVRG